MNTRLRWLSAAGNSISDVDALKDLEALEVGWRVLGGPATLLPAPRTPGSVQARGRGSKPCGRPAGSLGCQLWRCPAAEVTAAAAETGTATAPPLRACAGRCSTWAATSWRARWGWAACAPSRPSSSTTTRSRWWEVRLPPRPAPAGRPSLWPGPGMSWPAPARRMPGDSIRLRQHARPRRRRLRRCAARRVTAGLDKCRGLNTLVLSHNAVAGLGSWLGGLPQLEKLSLSHNQVQELGASLRWAAGRRSWQRRALAVPRRWRRACCPATLRWQACTAEGGRPLVARPACVFGRRGEGLPAAGDARLPACLPATTSSRLPAACPVLQGLWGAAGAAAQPQPAGLAAG